MADDEEQTGLWGEWTRGFAAGGTEFVERMRRRLTESAPFEEVAEVVEFGDEVRERWGPVLSAARDVVSHATELGWYLWRAGDDVETGELLDRLDQRTVELFAAFPNVADLYDDVDRVDAWLDEKVGSPGVQSALLRYFEWVERIVDGVVRRIVDVAIGGAEGGVDPDRAEAFLERLDGVLRQALERWIVDSTVRPGPTRPETDSSSESPESGAGRDRP